MAILLQTKPGINGANTLSIPKDWDSTWFRKFIANSLKGADVRNAVGSGGIVVSGNISSPYATIGFGAPVTLPGPVTITAPVTASPTLTLNGASNQSVLVINATGTSNPVQGIVINNDGAHDVDMAVSSTTAGDAYYRAVALGVTNWSWGVRRSDGAFVISEGVGLGAPVLTLAHTTHGASFVGSLSMNGNTPYAGSAGWGTPTGTGVVTNFPGGGPATLAQCSTVIATIIAILKNFGLMQA